MKKIAVVLLAILLSLPHSALWAQQDSAKVAEARDSLTVGQSWGLSLVLPSFGQFYNRQYWKAAVTLGGMGGLIYGAHRSNVDPTASSKERRQNRNLFCAGAGIVYLWSALDGATNYRFDNGVHSPAKAAIYSTMLPGLGQAYNQKYWKLPLVYGGFLTFGYLIQQNGFRYNLYGDAYNIKYKISRLDPQAENYQEKLDELSAGLDYHFRDLPLENLQSYKNKYRRNRDYYIILMVLFYGLNIVDATVDAHFFTYDMSNDLSFRITPFIDQQFAGATDMVTGLSFNFRF